MKFLSLAALMCTGVSALSVEDPVAKGLVALTNSFSSFNVAVVEFQGDYGPVLGASDACIQTIQAATYTVQQTDNLKGYDLDYLNMLFENLHGVVEALIVNLGDKAQVVELAKKCGTTKKQLKNIHECFDTMTQELFSRIQAPSPNDALSEAQTVSYRLQAAEDIYSQETCQNVR